MASPKVRRMKKVMRVELENPETPAAIKNILKKYGLDAFLERELSSYSMEAPPQPKPKAVEAKPEAVNPPPVKPKPVVAAPKPKPVVAAPKPKPVAAAPKAKKSKKL